MCLNERGTDMREGRGGRGVFKSFLSTLKSFYMTRCHLTKNVGMKTNIPNAFLPSTWQAPLPWFSGLFIAVAVKHCCCVLCCSLTGSRCLSEVLQERQVVVTAAVSVTHGQGGYQVQVVCQSITDVIVMKSGVLCGKSSASSISLAVPLAEFAPAEIRGFAGCICVCVCIYLYLLHLKFHNLHWESTCVFHCVNVCLSVRVSAQGGRQGPLWTKAGLFSEQLASLKRTSLPPLAAPRAPHHSIVQIIQLYTPPHPAKSFLPSRNPSIPPL